MDSQTMIDFDEYNQRLQKLVAEGKVECFFVERCEYPSDDAFILKYNDLIRELRASNQYSAVVLFDKKTGTMPAIGKFEVKNDVLIYAFCKTIDHSIIIPRSAPTSSRDDDSER